MKRNTRFAAVIAAGGVLLVGGTTAAAAVAADSERPARTQASPSYGPGYGPMMGQGRGTSWRGHMGGGPGGTGACLGAGLTVTAPSGTLSAAQKATLAAQAEEEKLAHDLYAAFAARYDTPIFDRISAAETRHLQAVRTLLGRYKVTDPTAGKAAGVFTSATVQAAYNRLLEQGKTNEQAALKAALSVEQADISALAKALNGLTAPDARQVYEHLLAASRMHQTMFERWIG